MAQVFSEKAQEVLTLYSVICSLIYFRKTGLFGGLEVLDHSYEFFGLEKGGIIGLARGGMMPEYTHGGIAKQPTYL